MRSRRPLVVLGAVGVVVGVVAAIAPSLAAALPVPTVPVAVVGGLAGVAALVVGSGRRNATFRAAEPPVVEEPVETPAPGDAYDDQLASMTSLGYEAAKSRRELRQHVRGVAIDVLVAADGYSPAAAEAALEDGTWTDDPVAAAYFTDDPATDGGAASGLRDRVTTLFRRQPTQREALERAIAVLAARTRGEDR